MSIQIQGISEFNRKLNDYQKRVSNPKVKTRILAAGGQKVRQVAAKEPTPKSDPNKKPFPTSPHYYYSGRGKVEIVPGNLRKSMKVFRGKEGDVYVGPRVLRRLAGASKIGQTAATSSGYYAHMIYKTASAFRVRIMEAALSKAQSAALNAVEKAFTKFHNSTGI